MSTLPAVTEALTLANARGLCHVSSDNGGYMTLTATNMERGGAVTTQRSKWDSPMNCEAVAAWAIDASAGGAPSSRCRRCKRSPCVR